MVLGLIRRRAAPARRICVLHAGLPKTGSSALQAHLARNAAALAKAGILYPAAGRRRGGVEHGDLMREMAGRPIFRGGSGMLAALEREIARRDHEVLLISSEFLHAPLYLLRTPRIRDWMAARGYALHVVVYLRDQPALLNSVYAQQVKTLREHRPFDAVLNERLSPDAPPGRMFRMENFLRAAGGWATHHFEAYDEAVRRSGVEPHFVALLRRICAGEGVAAGFDAAAAARLAPVGRVNEVCGPVQLAASRILAAEIADRFDRRARARATVGVFELIAAEIAAAGLSEPAYCGLTPARLRRIRAALSAGNDRFARAVWGCSWAERFGGDGPAPSSNDPDDTGAAAVLAQAREIAARARPGVMALIEERLRKGLV